MLSFEIPCHLLLLSCALCLWHQLPALLRIEGHSNRIYRESAQMWEPFIGYAPSMAEGGFYRAEINPGLSLLGLNTNLYYYKNRLPPQPDPGGQVTELN